MWDFFTTVLLVVKIFWFLGLTLKLYPYFPFSWISEPTKFWKNTLVIYLDFVFVVNLLIHNLILYSVFKVHFKPFGLWWRIRGSNPWPPACKAGALPAELIPHILVFLRTYCVTARSLRYSHTLVCSVPRNSCALCYANFPAQFLCFWTLAFAKSPAQFQYFVPWKLNKSIKSVTKTIGQVFDLLVSVS